MRLKIQLNADDIHMLSVMAHKYDSFQDSNSIDRIRGNKLKYLLKSMDDICAISASEFIIEEEELNGEK